MPEVVALHLVTSLVQGEWVLGTENPGFPASPFPILHIMLPPDRFVGLGHFAIKCSIASRGNTVLRSGGTFSTYVQQCNAIRAINVQVQPLHLRSIKAM